MPIPPNTTPGTATALTVDVNDTTVAADIALAPDGTGYTSSCKASNPQKNPLWYKYTVPVGIKYISFSVLGVPEFQNYKPFVTIWEETSPGVWTRIFDNNNYCAALYTYAPGTGSSFLLLVTPGNTYYFQVQNGGTGTIGHDLVVVAKHAPSGAPVAGDVIIPDDVSPFPAAILRSPGDSIIGYTAYDLGWNKEMYSVIQQGGWVLNEDYDSYTLVRCYGPPPDFTEISTIELSPWTTYIYDICSDQVSKHYVLTILYGTPDTYYLHKIDAATGVKEATYTLPSPAYGLIGINASSNIAYYISDTDFSTIHRFDMTTETALSDFLVDSTYFRYDGFVLPDGTVGIASNMPLSDWQIYQADGTPINTFERSYHRFSLDNDLTGIWFWSASQEDYEHAMIATLDTNDESFTVEAITSASGGPKGIYDGITFAVSNSCPIMVYPVTTSPPPTVDISGIYFINPDKADKHDSYYDDVEKKIPDPTIRTALIGE